MVHISTSNTKTHIPSFNLLAGENDLYKGYMPHTMRDLATVGGTCGRRCPGCYAERMTRYTGTFSNMVDNTIAAKNGNDEEIKKAVCAFCELNEPRRFRIHDSGDFINLEYLILWDEIARETPETVFYCYTKRIDLLKAFREKFGRMPALVISVSTWAGICEEKDLIENGCETLPRFEYDDGTRPELAKLPHCPAVSKDGKRTGITCNQCKHCSKARNGEKWAVYAH